MHNGDPCPMFPKETFSGGIVNGAKWYVVTGGMQDWNYVYAGCMELTIELGCYKYPLAEKLPEYWMDNREALLKYIEQVKKKNILLIRSYVKIQIQFQVHIGVRGFVFSTIGRPIPFAKIIVEGINHIVKTGKDGDYFRLLLPGQYNLTVFGKGFEAYTQKIIIPESGSLELNVTLLRDNPVDWASAYDFGLSEHQFRSKYHSNSEIYKLIADFENKYPDTASFSGGDSFVSMSIHYLKISHEVCFYINISIYSS